MAPIPDDLFARVAALAAQRGQSPADVIAAATEASIAAHMPSAVAEDVPGYDPALDPLARFAGTYTATDPDVTLRHDAYLAEDSAQAHAGEK